MDQITAKFKQPIVSSSSNLDSLVIKEYQANLKIFLNKVEQQVAMLIQKYQNQLKELKKQNVRLKERLTKYEGSNPEDIIFRTGFNFDQNISSVKKNIANERFLSDGFKLFHSTPHKNYFECLPEDLSSSRFEVEKSRKKIHQQSLLASLEAGKSNLNQNTSKLLDLMGRNQKKISKQTSSEEEQEIKSTSQKQDVMNTSLSSVCQSLDNSFHGKRSKKKNQLKRKEKQKLKALRLQQAKKNYQEKKELGLKNLLKTLRQNVSSSDSRPLQTLKNLRVAHSAYDNESSPNPMSQKQKKSSPTKSKVLIDPNPIDISVSKSKSNFKDPSKKPQSILKQNSTILTKSLLSD